MSTQHSYNEIFVKTRARTAAIAAPFWSQKPTPAHPGPTPGHSLIGCPPAAPADWSPRV